MIPMLKEELIKAIKRTSGQKDVQLEFPENDSFGDYSTNVALQKKGKNPRELAKEIVGDLGKDASLMKLVEKIEVAGPGFINFWIKSDVLVDNLTEIDSKKAKYGETSSEKGKKIMFEYAHPNTHKAFHIGHLRNITTGESLSRLYEAVGADIVRVNYQGDVGLHIAKAIWGIKKIGFSDPGDVHARAEFLGKAYATGAKAYEEDKGAKKEIDEINVKIYDASDPEINKIYKETRAWSLGYFELIYKRVYTKFDRLYFESEVAESGKEIALEALKKGILQKSEGAVIFPGSKYGLHDRVFISGKGVPTYEAKDLGLAKLQFKEYNPDKLIHTVGPEQTAYFQVLFKALELILPETKGREIHVPYGWVRLKSGKMSSRTGQVVLGEKILDEAKEKIKREYKTEDETAEMIAVAAVKYSFLKTSLNQDIAFDLEESISLEGNSGPYLQYTVARTNSVLAKVKGGKQEVKINRNAIIQLNSGELSLLRGLIKYPEVVEAAAKMFSPNLLCNYLYDLAQKYNSFYNSERIIGSDSETFRLVLTFGVSQVLKNGLNLLGIETPERM